MNSGGRPIHSGVTDCATVCFDEWANEASVTDIGPNRRTTDEPEQLASLATFPSDSLQPVNDRFDIAVAGIPIISRGQTLPVSSERPNISTANSNQTGSGHPQTSQAKWSLYSAPTATPSPSAKASQSDTAITPMAETSRAILETSKNGDWIGGSASSPRHVQLCGENIRRCGTE